ncbi:hypothetical protein [Aquabacter spiritensis]|uniref:Uncharacterized protein n=1 Tax=Aquabacter spiritensis TaxID=933073 RepID=A0A4R3M789_9HYPH|nr:hypothetical protein [Aquabacter spiritensis]TCT08129.1 hypothetical protein EDC64_101650 [Aquabacter spiritensis]
MLNSAARAVVCLFALLSPALAAPLAVEVRNDSAAVLCAEKDNVALTFSASAVRRFRIEAVHPAYLGTLRADRTAPDWTQCDMSGDPRVPAKPRTEILYSSAKYRLVGFTFASFWRPATVPVEVGGRSYEGLHMVQLFVATPRGRYEALVFYPPDGYWRARPLPPPHLKEAAYGSSFLVGPVEVEGRPVVRLKAVAFDPATATFTLGFAAGGSAKMRIAELNSERQALDIGFSAPVEGRPFAALRSMYVTAFNNDAAAVAVKPPDAAGWLESPIMAFPGGPVLELWAGRVAPSRHNTSAPDMVFGPFEGP